MSQLSSMGFHTVLIRSSVLHCGMRSPAPHSSSWGCSSSGAASALGVPMTSDLSGARRFSKGPSSRLARSAHEARGPARRTVTRSGTCIVVGTPAPPGIVAAAFWTRDLTSAPSSTRVLPINGAAPTRRRAAARRSAGHVSLVRRSASENPRGDTSTVASTLAWQAG